jgi:very-short-patch-repair endonuclease
VRWNEYDPTALPRIISRDWALKAGYSPDAIKYLLATGRWTRILPRTYLTSDTMTWADRLRAATTFAGPGALLSGAAALCDRGLASVRRPGSILVLAPPGAGPHSTQWVRVRRSDRPMARALHPGPPRVSDARAIADLAIELRRVDDVRALVADAVRTRLCTPDELVDELVAGPRRGSAHFRQAIEEVGAGAWSAPEARAATLLRRAHVPAFKQNRRIDLPGGKWYWADFIWAQLRAILEIDSRKYHELPPDDEHTSDRHIELEILGFTVIHRTPRFIRFNPDRFVDQVSRWLSARTLELAR